MTKEQKYNLQTLFCLTASTITGVGSIANLIINHSLPSALPSSALLLTSFGMGYLAIKCLNISEQEATINFKRPAASVFSKTGAAPENKQLTKSLQSIFRLVSFV